MLAEQFLLEYCPVSEDSPPPPPSPPPAVVTICSTTYVLLRLLTTTCKYLVSNTVGNRPAARGKNMEDFGF